MPRPARHEARHSRDDLDLCAVHDNGIAVIERDAVGHPETHTLDAEAEAGPVARNALADDASPGFIEVGRAGHTAQPT